MKATTRLCLRPLFRLSFQNNLRPSHHPLPLPSPRQISTVHISSLKTESRPNNTLLSTMTENLASPMPAPASVAGSAYQFPSHRLKTRQSDPTRIPLVLVACGSFSPITYLHLRMFELAADFAKFNTEFEVIGGYLSPVSDAYKKAGLASSQHRYGSIFEFRDFRLTL